MSSIQSSVRVYLESGKAFHSHSDTHKTFQFVNHIVARKGHSVEVELLDCELPISYYPVNSTNNKIVFNYSISGSLSITIEPGQYSATEMASYLTAQGLPTSYKAKTNKFTFTPSSAGYFSTATTSHKILGVSTGSSSQSVIVGTKQVNLSGITNIFVKLMNLSIENIDSEGKQSGLLAKIVVNQPFGTVLLYEDFHHSKNILADKQIERLEIKLVDADGHEIGGDTGMNGMDFSMTLVFNFLPTKELNITGDELISKLNALMSKK